MPLDFEVNGERRECPADPMTPLLDVLREQFHLTGAKPVCREGFCGACTVLLDDRPVVSCLVPVGMAGGRSVRTAEAIAGAGGAPLQQALEDLDAVQCGMCFPGMVVTLTAALRDRPDATREEIRAALVGNICRCTGYERIIDAALAVARRT